MKNKYEEALNYFLDREEGENVTVTCDWSIYAEELYRLVDKEIPKKPNRNNRYCGNCDVNRLIKGNDNYCSVCGQKIDWSDEE